VAGPGEGEASPKEVGEVGGRAEKVSRVGEVGGRAEKVSRVGSLLVGRRTSSPFSGSDKGWVYCFVNLDVV